MSYNKETILAISKRLDELSNAVTKGKKGIDREFYMSIPARPLLDADLVLSTASNIVLEKDQLCGDLENHIKQLEGIIRSNLKLFDLDLLNEEEYKLFIGRFIETKGVTK